MERDFDYERETDLEMELERGMERETDLEIVSVSERKFERKAASKGETVREKETFLDRDTGMVREDDMERKPVRDKVFGKDAVMTRTAFHNHSMYSDNSTVKPEELVRMSAEMGFEHVVLTDHNTIAGIKEFMQAGEKYGIHTIPGAELSVPEHIVVTARNNDGYYAIMNAIADIVRIGNPSEDTIKHYFLANENVIITTGCLSGAIPKILLSNIEYLKKKTYLEEQIQALKGTQLLFDEASAEIKDLTGRIAQASKTVSDFAGYTKQPYQDRIDELKKNFQFSLLDTETPESMEEKRDYAFRVVNEAQAELKELKIQLKSAQDRKRSEGYKVKQYNTFCQELSALPTIDEAVLYKQAKLKLLQYKEWFPHLYVELPIHDMTAGAAYVMPILVKLAKECGVGYIVSQNTHSLTKDDKKSLAMRYQSQGLTMLDAGDAGLLSYDELKERLEKVIGTEDAETALETLSVFSSCRVSLEAEETCSAGEEEESRIMDTIRQLAEMYGVVPRQELKHIPIQPGRVAEWIENKGFVCGIGRSSVNNCVITVASRIRPYVLRSLKAIYGEQSVYAVIKKQTFSIKESIMLAADGSYDGLAELIRSAEENNIEEYFSLLDTKHRKRAEQIYNDALLLDGVVKELTTDESKIVISKRNIAAAWNKEQKIWMCDTDNGAIEIRGSIELDILSECLQLILKHQGKIAEISYDDSISSDNDNKGFDMDYINSYMSAHYPLEYTCAMLNYSGNFKSVSREILLPPDINCSFYDYTITGDKIRCGFSCINGVTLQAITPIVNERSGYQTEKPYRSFIDFLLRNSNVVEDRVVMPSREVMSGLILAGAFDRLHPNRDSLLMAYEQAFEISKNAKHFNDIANIKLTHQKADVRKNRCYELMYIGQVVGEVPCFDNVSEWDYACQSTEQVRDAGHGYIMGIVTQTTARKTSKYRDMLTVMLHTKHETIEVLLFDDNARESDLLGEVIKVSVTYHDDTFFGNYIERLVQPGRRFFVDVTTKEELDLLAEAVRGENGNNLLYIRSRYHKGELLQIPRLYEPMQVSDAVVGKIKAVLL